MDPIELIKKYSLAKHCINGLAVINFPQRPQ